jgi:hypothetical protein
MTRRTAGFVHADKPHDLPDVTNGVPCCYGHAVYGPGGCTCWQRVDDLEQQPARTGIEPRTRERMCADCAYRPGSPERTGSERAPYDEDDVRALAESDATFWCHQGMPRTIQLRHEETGDVVDHLDPEKLAYNPLIIDGVPYKADGTPADRCAGQAALRRSLKGRGR